MFGRIPARGERQRDRKGRARKTQNHPERKNARKAVHPERPRHRQSGDDDQLSDRARPLRPDPVDEQTVHHPKQRAGKRSEEHTSELQSLMRQSYDVFYWKKKKTN